MKNRLLRLLATTLGLIGVVVVSTASFIWVNQPKAPASMLGKK